MMKCEKVQRWLLMQNETEDENPGFEAHLTTCTACQAFQNNLMALRQNLDQSEFPEPSETLIQQTVNQCRNVIRWDESVRTAEPPKWILAGTLGWMLATMLLIGFSFYHAESGWNISKVMTLVLLVQNILMLFFSPLLLSRIHSVRVAINQNPSNLSNFTNSFC